MSARDLEQRPHAIEGRFVRLRVQDTGGGIAPSDLPRIFEPFFTTKDVGKGSGLGLATVFGIVEQHHGWIDVASELGRGTTFEIFVPALPGSGGASRREREWNTLVRGTESILLVERQPRLKVIYSSGYSYDAVRPDMRLMPGHNFLQKPYHLAEMAATVRRCLDER